MTDWLSQRAARTSQLVAASGISFVIFMMFFDCDDEFVNAISVIK